MMMMVMVMVVGSWEGSFNLFAYTTGINFPSATLKQANSVCSATGTNLNNSAVCGLSSSKLALSQYNNSW